MRHDAHDGFGVPDDGDDDEHPDDENGTGSQYEAADLDGQAGDASTTDGSMPKARRVYPPPNFTVEDLSSPDDARRIPAFTAMFGQNWDRLMHSFAGAEPDEDLREDLVQQIFLKAHNNLQLRGSQLRVARAAFSWLRMIGRNILKDRYRAEESRSKMMSAYGAYAAVEAELQSHAETPLERLEREDPYDANLPVDAKTFRARVAALTDRDQKILHLRAVERLDWEAIGKEVSMTEEAAKQRYHRFTARLRQP